MKWKPAGRDTAKAGSEGGPLVVLRNLEKRFGAVRAVKDLNLEIEGGTFVAIMGPSGCGKTTTLRMLAGLETPTRGEVWFRGEDITFRKPWQRNMPMVWQNLALFPFLDVVSNVAFGLRMSGVPKRDRERRACVWLERLGILELADRDISVLSGGQLQRVALARALVTEPSVLLLDEPLSALDAHLVARMQAELTRLQQELGITFVYVTHNQSEAFAMADRIVIMNEGVIQQSGGARDVYRQPANRFVAEFIGNNNLFAGSVKSAQKNRLAVETNLGILYTESESNRAMTVGTDVYVVVSADRIVVDEGDSAEEKNSVTGILVTERFTGAVIIAYLDIGQETELAVQLQQAMWEGLNAQPGDTLKVTWDPGACFTIRA